MVPGLVASSTEALGLRVSSLNSVSFGMTRWTVAARTSWIDPMVLLSSPSRARWKSTR